jgi:hypothetical protein
MENQELTPEQIDERVAVLKRYRALLVQQREKFAQYLKTLEKQENSIENEDAELLLAHTELEQQVLSSISSLKKCILPMEALYKESLNSTWKAQDADAISIQRIESELDNLQAKVLAQNEKNRSLLKSHMTALRTRINRIYQANPYRGKVSVYAQQTENSSSLLDIEV